MDSSISGFPAREVQRLTTKQLSLRPITVCLMLVNFLFFKPVIEHWISELGTAKVTKKTQKAATYQAEFRMCFFSVLFFSFAALT